MNLNKSIDNLNICLKGKVSVEQKVRSPSVNIRFEVKKVETSNSSSLILAAVDDKTNTYLYIAESDPVDGRWKARESEFSDRIYLFVNKVMEEMEYVSKVDEMTIMEQGKVLEQLATKIYQKFSN
jgi:hypothetical protein